MSDRAPSTYLRIRLDYHDQNEGFGKLLPRDGTVDRIVQSANGDAWVLFRLDASIEFDNRAVGFLLLRSRWIGKAIGDREPTSVFVLIVDDATRVLDGFAVDDFQHVAWGMVSRLS